MQSRTPRPWIAATILGLVLTFSASAAGPLADLGNGTLQDGRTGLVWVADPRHAVTTGFADRVLMPRAEALAFVAAMNAGAIENFGHTTWRLPSAAELEHVLNLRRAPGLAGLDMPSKLGADPSLVFAWPVKAGGAPPGFDQVSVFATNSIELKNNARVLSGSVIVNAPSADPALIELVFGQGTSTSAAFDVAADAIEIKASAQIGCDDPGADGICDNVFCNQLTDESGSVGCTPLGTDPVFDFLPTFVAEPPRPTAPNVTVAVGGSLVLAAGDYGVLQIADGATVTFSGGRYNLGAVQGGENVKLRFEAPSEVRIAGKLVTGKNSSIGPAPGSGLTAADVVFYVAGQDDAAAVAAEVGRANVAEANFYVADGTFRLRQNAAATGAFLARDVVLENGATVALRSAFANRPPTADPQEVFTAGGGAITITLTGSDPDGDSLSFSIVTNPTAGTLSNLTPIVPDPVTDPETGETVQPPVVSATVTYTPNGPDDVQDSFVFQVADGAGGVGTATVTINPPPEPPDEPPPLAGVVAIDRSAATSVDVPVLLLLRGEAPCEDLPNDPSDDVQPCDGVGDDVPLTISIASGPANGALGALTQGSEVPQRTATVTYTPDPGFESPPADSFVFEACGTIAGVETCDQGTVTVEVIEARASAKDQTVTTPEETPVTVTLSGDLGFPGSEGSQIFRKVFAPGAVVVPTKAAFDQGAAVAGNVAASDGIVGDNHNDLPGPVPVLMAAAVDATGGPGSNGNVRMHVEWRIRDLIPFADEITDAQVVLNTQRGTVDSLDTMFFAGTFDGDGILDDFDFAISAQEIDGVVMPVPDVPVGTDGTFAFDVTSLLVDALDTGLGFFTIQGRVAEAPIGSGFARGLQVRTSATGNLANELEPQLAVTTSGAVTPLTFSIVALPQNGTLADEFGGTIVETPQLLISRRVVYTPSVEFAGVDLFEFQVDNGISTAIGRVSVIVGTGPVGDCDVDEDGCDDGR